MTVLRNEFNQGYGGNQKVGYAFAIREGFDFVAMVHGDGQYAPEELPTLVAPLRDGRGRRGVRQPHDDPASVPSRAACRSTSSSATGSSAAIQNLLLGTSSDGVPQRLPRLFGGGAAENSATG